MARPAMFRDDQLLDAALALVAAGGPNSATIAAISASVGAPVGSIYHRFESRELLMAHLWIRSVKRFQGGFLDALATDDLDAAAVGAVRHAARWSCQHPAEVRVLLLHRREDLATTWPSQLGEELADLNRGVEQALRSHARRRYGDDDEVAMARVTLALVDLPYAAARRYLVGGTSPTPTVEDLLVATCRFVLDGERG